jgi:hypothetical protein
LRGASRPLHTEDESEKVRYGGRVRRQTYHEEQRAKVR